MCLFNSDFLLSKVQDALVIVGTEEEEEEGGGDECLGESFLFARKRECLCAVLTPNHPRGFERAACWTDETLAVQSPRPDPEKRSRLRRRSQVAWSTSPPGPAVESSRSCPPSSNALTSPSPRRETLPRLALSWVRSRASRRAR